MQYILRLLLLKLALLSSLLCTDAITDRKIYRALSHFMIVYKGINTAAKLCRTQKMLVLDYSHCSSIYIVSTFNMNGMTIEIVNFK